MKFLDFNPFIINLDNVAYIQYGDEPEPNNPNQKRRFAIVTYAGAIGSAGCEIRYSGKQAEEFLRIVNSLK
jgi:hypothetical protein